MSLIVCVAPDADLTPLSRLLAGVAFDALTAALMGLDDAQGRGRPAGHGTLWIGATPAVPAHGRLAAAADVHDG